MIRKVFQIFSSEEALASIIAFKFSVSSVVLPVEVLYFLMVDVYSYLMHNRFLSFSK